MFTKRTQMVFLIKVSTNVWTASKSQHKRELVSIGRRELIPWQEGVKAMWGSGKQQNLVPCCLVWTPMGRRLMHPFLHPDMRGIFST